jgi:hypothetical protein
MLSGEPWITGLLLAVQLVMREASEFNILTRI